ncbi:zinc dependent phospholipase C family protein [uncultured Clostridium sp.]|uniref:zinc dependent phospholipase C family protein n=1 Tax=uncultured Clostridium sp. TaxID=59620 RepID=UPI0025FD4839|nr:zinc dependent phospholipase C family protein [uncultured Clostridium sp.]
MKVRTHFHLAKLSLSNIKSSYPENFSLNMFYLGTILADCCWLTYTNPHFYKKSEKYVEKKLDLLLEKDRFNWYNSLQLGIVIHYLCDFCCYSHITDKVGNINDHMIYERKIQKYLLENMTIFNGQHKNKNSRRIYDLQKIIEKQILKYRKGRQCFKWDIQNCIEMSSNVCEVIFRKFENKELCRKIPV